VNSAISASGFSFFVAVTLWVGFRRLKEIRKETKKMKNENTLPSTEAALVVTELKTERLPDTHMELSIL
jgi:hypothetical protein